MEAALRAAVDNLREGSFEVELADMGEVVEGAMR